MATVKRNQAVIWSDAQGGKFGGFLPLGVGRYGSEDATLPGPGREAVYVQNENGDPVVGVAFETPPGGLPSFTINFFEQYAKNHLRTAKEEGRSVAVQQRFHQYGVLTNPTGWTKLFHYGEGVIGEETRAGAQIEYTGEALRGGMPVTYENAFEFFRPTLTAQTPPAQVANALGVAFVDKPLKGIVAYPGPNKVGFVALAAVAEATANLLATRNGGGIWVNASADPFATDENIGDVVVFVTNPAVGGRVIVSCPTTDAGAKAKIARADFTWSAPQTLTWTSVVTTNGSNGDTVTAIGWKNYTELLICSAGDIYVSSDAGESWNGAAIYTGSTAINKIFFAPEHPNLEPYAYFIGASNLILRKKLGSNTVDTLVGPSGGGTFYSGAVAIDGTIWAGNGQKLYRSSDGATTAAGWTEVKDFGSNKTVVAINPVKGDPQVLQVVVDDTTPGDGSVYVSADGVTFELITNLANDGYNAAFFSTTDPNWAIVVGDDDSAAPVVHKLDVA